MLRCCLNIVNGKVYGFVYDVCYKCKEAVSCNSPSTPCWVFFWSSLSQSDESADLVNVTSNINSDLGSGQQADLEAYDALFYGVGMDGGPLTPPLVHDFAYAVGVTALFTVVATHTNPETKAITTSRLNLEPVTMTEQRTVHIAKGGAGG